MPYIQQSTYKAPFLFRNGHLATVYPALFRKVPMPEFQRERIKTPDHDFLDLDWVKNRHNRLVIVLHGLEGNAQRHYITGMINYFGKRGWDGLGVNLRGCSGEDNLQLRSYHMCATDDLDTVIQHVINHHSYKRIALVGFSLGGSLIINYLGGQKFEIPDEIRTAVAFSVPTHTTSAAYRIAKWDNSLYIKRFMKTLNEKIESKAKQYPDAFQLPPEMPKTLGEFDEKYTAPVHGFESPMDYYSKCSPVNNIPNIKIPILLVNAQNDSFLSEKCFPHDIASNSNLFHFEAPKHGGHVGFVEFNKDGSYWSERRAYEFIAGFAE